MQNNDYQGGYRSGRGYRQQNTSGRRNGNYRGYRGDWQYDRGNDAGSSRDDWRSNYRDHGFGRYHGSDDRYDSSDRYGRNSYGSRGSNNGGNSYGSRSNYDNQDAYGSSYGDRGGYNGRSDYGRNNYGSQDSYGSGRSYGEGNSGNDRYDSWNDSRYSRGRDEFESDREERAYGDNYRAANRDRYDDDDRHPGFFERAGERIRDTWNNWFHHDDDRDDDDRRSSRRYRNPNSGWSNAYTPTSDY